MQGIETPMLISAMLRFTSGLGDLAKDEILTGRGWKYFCAVGLLHPILHRVRQRPLVFVDPSPIAPIVFYIVMTSQIALQFLTANMS